MNIKIKENDPLEVKSPDIYDGLEPIEKTTLKMLFNKLNYSILESLIRIANENDLSTDTVMSKKFAPEAFDQNGKLLPFIKGFLRQKGNDLLENKTKSTGLKIPYSD